jgi:hypothetical protein
MSTIELPDPLPYPKLLPFNDSQLSGKFCYIFKKYSTTKGVTAVIFRQSDIVTIRMADFTGKILDAKEVSKEVMEYTSRCAYTMKCSRVPKAIFYFSMDEKIRLVDMRLSINKFCSPGYLRDFYGKQGIPTQEAVGDPVILAGDVLSAILEGKGDYSYKKFIIKPSAFKFICRGDDILPQYGVVEDETKSIT